jgi:hypothetical protein
MVWGSESPRQAGRFEAKALPPGRIADPEASAVLGVGAGAPEVDPVEGGDASGGVGPSAGQGAWRRRLAPHHREAVRVFFGPIEKRGGG